MMRRSVLVALALLVLAAASCGPQDDDRATGIPMEVPADGRPSRIISVIPAVTEMLFAIGAGDQVVGVGSYDRFPAEALSRPRVGALVDPDVERILSLHPDLVVVYSTQDDLIVRLERASIPTFRYQHAGLADITETIRALGQRVGRSEEAETVAGRIERDLAGIQADVAGLPRPQTALLFEREPGSLRGLFASGGVGFMHDMLVTAGGANAFVDVDRQSVQLSTETLLARAPDVIVEFQGGEGWSADRLAKEQQVWQLLPSLPAVRAGRVYILADARLAIPGPRVAEAVRLLANVLHPGASAQASSAAATGPRIPGDEP